MHSANLPSSRVRIWKLMCSALVVCIHIYSYRFNVIEMINKFFRADPDCTYICMKWLLIDMKLTLFFDTYYAHLNHILTRIRIYELSWGETRNCFLKVVRPQDTLDKCMQKMFCGELIFFPSSPCFILKQNYQLICFCSSPFWCSSCDQQRRLGLFKFFLSTLLITLITLRACLGSFFSIFACLFLT